MYNETIGVRLKAEGYDTFVKELQDAQMRVRTLSGKEFTVNLRASAKELKRTLKELDHEIKGLTRREQTVRLTLQDLNARKKATQVGTDARKRIEEEIAKTEAEIRHIRADKTALNIMRDEVKNALEGIDVNWGATFKKGKSFQGMIGTALETIGNAFTSIGNNPISQALTGMLYQVGYNVTNTMSQGLTESINRYDIVRTYPKILKRAFGDGSADQAAASIDKLQEAVLGMPTSLDTLVDAAQKYALVMNDIEKGTSLAIAADSAFLASGATDTQRYQGIMQINDLISGKELNAREWMSLISAMPVGIRKVAEHLNRGGEEYKNFINDLKQNKIPNDVFVDALIAVGDLNGELRELAELGAKDKVSTGITIIRQAFARLGESVIDAFDNSLRNITGKGLVENLWDVRLAIDKISAEIVNWINNNQDKIKAAIDAIKNFDYMEFLKGFATGLIDGLKLIGKALNTLGGIDERKVGRFLGIAPMLGRFITTLGQFVKGTSPLGGLATVAGVFLVKRGGLGTLFAGLKNVFGGGGVAGMAEAAGGAGMMREASANLANNVLGLMKNLAGLIAIAGEIAILVRVIKDIGESMKEIGKLKVNWVQAAKTLYGISGVIAAVMLLGLGASKIASVMGQIALGVGLIGLVFTEIAAFAALDTYLFKKTANNIKQIAQSLDEAGKILANFHWRSGSFDDLTKAIADMATVTESVGLRESVINKWTSGNMAKMTKNILNIAKTLGEIGKVASEIESPPETALTAIKDSAKFIGDIASLFAGEELDRVFRLGGLDGGEIGKKQANNLNDIIRNMKSVIDNIIAIIDAMKASEDKLAGLLTANGRRGRDVTYLDTLQEDFATFTEKLAEVFDSIIKNLDEPLMNRADEVSGITKNIASTINNIGAIVDAMNSAKDKVKAIITRGGKHSAEIDEIQTNFYTFTTKLQEFFSEIAVKLSPFTADATAEIKDKADNIKGTFEAINQIIVALTDFKTKYSQLMSGGRGQGQSTLGALTTNIGTITTYMQDIADKIKGVTVEEGMADNVESLRLAMEKMVGVVVAFQKIKTEIEKLGDTSIGNTIAQIVSEIANALTGIDQDAGLAVKVEAFRTSLTNLQTAISGFGGAGLNLSFVGLSESIRAVGTALDEVTGKMEGVGQKWHDGLVKGLNMGNVLKVIDKSLTGFGWSMKGFSAGMQYRRGVMSALSNLSVTISATMNASAVWWELARIRASAANIRVGGSSAFASRLFASTGGYITAAGLLYRAMGGRIFKTRGTDRIPVMASAGEYMMNRRAVGKYGVGFMQRLNNLDLNGALQSLSVRMGGMLPNVGRSVINNTTNNNQSVAQYISTNNPNYSYRRANRFVRSLS